MRKLTHAEIRIITSALEVAAEVYRRDAKLMIESAQRERAENVRTVHQRIALQFERQAIDMERMIGVISAGMDAE